MDYPAFLQEIQCQGSHPHLIHGSLGSRDVWKWVRKNGWKLLGGKKCDPSTFSTIIKRTNEILADYLLAGHSVEFPYQMGTLMLIGLPSRVTVKGNELKNNYKVDWKKTLEWWYEDAEARKNKTCVKRIQKTLYYIRYSKGKACYRNQKYYRLKISRRLIRALGKKIETERVNAFIKSSIW